MANKHAGKSIQMLSPENYIRTKARTLPIYECLVNAGWRKEGIAHVIIARNHVNGNITACFYLVDVFCLGVKESQYVFNIPKGEYKELIRHTEDMDAISISYALAHNIIYAALEYAEKFGFKPHKDFTSITRFMLDEDTDDVELIEIECGREGKPFLIYDKEVDEQKTNSIIKQLGKTAGVGNFSYLSSDIWEEYGYDEDEDDDLEGTKFKDWTFEEKKKLFLDLHSRTAALEGEELFQFLQVSNSIFEGIVDGGLFEKYYDEYCDDLNIDIVNDVISDEMLGVIPGTKILRNETRVLFLLIYFEVQERTRLSATLLKEFKKIHSDLPASYFLELQLLYMKKPVIYARKLKEYADKFPDYPLIKLLQLREQIKTNPDSTQYLDPKYSCFTIFHERNQIHTIEIIQYILFYVTILTRLNDPSRMQAFIQACQRLDLPKQNIPTIEVILQFSKTCVVHSHLTR